MNGVTLHWEDHDYTFVLFDIKVDLFTRMFQATFFLYLGEERTNKIYTITRMGENFDPLMNYNNYSLYYKMLCEDLGLDPSIIPDGLTLII